MVHAADEHVFEDVGIRAVSEVVHENGRLGRLHFGVEEEYTFPAQGFESLLHEVAGADGVLFARVLRAGIDQPRKSELADAVQPLKKRMADNVAEQAVRESNEPIDRVVDDEAAIVHIQIVSLVWTAQWRAS